MFSFFSSWLDRATTLLQGPTLSLQMVELECVAESQFSRLNSLRLMLLPMRRLSVCLSVYLKLSTFKYQLVKLSKILWK